MKEVIVRQEQVTIPTYPIAAYDKNPMFLEKRVYQGSSGRVYPHPVCEAVSDTKVDRTYQAIYLENDYLLVMVLPELGGRIQRLYDKTNGYDAVYYNEVIKPALVGLAGPWISGGIEFNWPQHHRPSTYDPVDWKVERSADGSVTVWVGETEKMFHTKGMAGFTLYPDRAYLEIHGQVYNPTDRPQTFLWWANPAVAVNDDTQSIFPPDVHAVMDHGKRAVSKFPIADGVYYKYDYAPGTDISRYKNIPVPTSYMAYHSDYNFIGNYDYGRKAGLLHIADHHVSPGKKQWTWGCGDFGKAWDRNLTDANGPYIELMTGVFTDNQPDFTFLKPYEEKTFVQYFMPYKEAGALKNASTQAAIGVEQDNGAIRVTVYAPERLTAATLRVLEGGKEVFSRPLELAPTESVCATIGLEDTTHYTVQLCKGEAILLQYTPVRDKEPVPAPAEEIPAPDQLPSTEKLFLAATHLEQYRHATRNPADYYLEGLRRDPEDLRLNNGYGKYLYNKGLFSESECYFRRAIKTATWKNPNPYDCEPYYNLGLALRRQKKDQQAFDAFYKATWDGNLQDRAFYQLACVACQQGETAQALDFVEKSLIRGLHNLKARALKTALLRRMGCGQTAQDFAAETRKIDPLDHAANYEICRLTGDGWENWQQEMRAEEHNYIELALTYSEAGLAEDAADILHRAPLPGGPMLHYYLYALTQEEEELAKAERAPSLYCFPNRLEDLLVLKNAVQKDAPYAAYYLGCLLYDRGRWQEAQTYWEDCAQKIALPTVWRNLALVYYNKHQDGARARAAMKKAFALDPTDARVFFELDQLEKTLNAPFAERLNRMKEQAALLEQRDDLYTEYITLLNLNGEYEKAYRFEPLKMEQPLRRHLRMGGSAPSGEKIEVTSRCIERGGKPWLPVMGEYHFVRDQKENWYRELCKMKAGGIDIVATYVIWIYHEEREGIFDFTGDRDLRAFVEAAQKAGLDVLLRIGPWVHGECRNGGFPDWLLKKPFPLRKSNAGYMELVRQWYGHIYKEVQGLFYKDGGNIIGIQVENELTDDAQHLLDLKKLAVEIGFEVPLYTVTGWNSLYGAKIPVDDVLPVFGAYVDAPWADTLEQLPPSPHFVFDSMRNDAAIGMDQIIQAPEDGWILPYERYPFATCELGAGLQPTHHRRMIVSAQDAYALSLVKLGSGNNLVGYYMCHGGINKIGELSTFNESRASGYPNDCPILSYFEHTAISSYGETGETYRKLNLLHLFLHDFGSQLAPLPYVASQVHPKPEDPCTLRYAMRTDGSKGFVFVNQYQRLHKMKPLEDVRLDTGSVQFPVLKITDGASFILPFNIPLGNVKLRYATAQLLCRMGDTWFFTEIEGNSPEYCLDGEIYRPEQLPDVHRVKDSCIVTLPKEQALYLRKLHGSVFLGDQCDLYWMDEQIHAVQPGSFSYMEWNGTHFIHQEQRKEYVPAQLEETSLKDLAFLPPYWDELQLNGPRKVLCKKISVTTPEGFVEISDVCDAAQIYANGVLAADEYYCGVPWRIPANLLYGKECYLFLSEIKNDFYREF